jgi:MerR family mercuric resistance operon transcriptional regulator
MSRSSGPNTKDANSLRAQPLRRQPQPARAAPAKPPKPLTIGKVARLAGVGIETIRFYEREGLVADPPRKQSGYRQYGAETVARLRFIHRARELGFSLGEIKDLLFLRVDPTQTCGHIVRKAEEKILEIDEKIQALLRMKEALAAFARACPGQGPVSECPVIDVPDDFYRIVYDPAQQASAKPPSSRRK